MTNLILINMYPEDCKGVNEGTIEPPLGLGYLAAVAEQGGVSCRIIDANLLLTKIDDIVLEISKDMPIMIGISVNLYSYRSCLKLVDVLKKIWPWMPVILGGPTPTSSPDKMMDACLVDAVAVGEGEDTLRQIIENYKSSRHLFKGVDGVYYRENNNIVRNRDRDFIKNIDTIPFPAYHLFPDLNKYRSRTRKSPIAPILTSRGCPYQCIYCSKDVFKNTCRMRSPENILDEIEMLVKEFGVKQIDILDDNFTVDKVRMEKILDLLIERDYDLWINLQTGVRTENLDRCMINKMKEAKIWKMPIGVESGDPDILKRIKKKLDLNKVLDVTRMAKEAGIIVYGFFMIGLPGDTSKSMQKTIDFAIKMNPNIANFCITIPFPGTELYQIVKKEGRFIVDMDNGLNFGFYASKVFYELEGMNAGAVLKYYKKAMWRFYLRPRKIFELLTGIKSKEEVQWFLKTGWAVLRNIFSLRNRAEIKT